MHPPDFWYGPKARWRGTALAPLSRLFTVGARVRGLLSTAWRAPVPVLCVGNLTVGGTGKTPVALDLGQRLTEQLAGTGHAVGFVSRGHGGRLAGPERVEPGRHNAADVGDEPLLLAAIAPTWVARHRAEGVKAAVAAGSSIVILDDGFQNPSVAKDLSLVVVDGARGFGNGRVLPAGPLREPVAEGLGRADAVVVMGGDESGVADTVAAIDRSPPIPALGARLVPDETAHALAGKRVVAFAGIGDPDKFFRTLTAIGCEIAVETALPDHARLDSSTIEAQLRLAVAGHADAVVTTAKDAVRLPPALASSIIVVNVKVTWSEPEMLDQLLAPILAHVL